MLTFLLLLLLYALLRRRSLAVAALIAGCTAIYVVTHGGWLLPNAPADHFAPSIVDVALFVGVQTAVVVVAVRFGLLTMLVASFVSTLLTLLPIVVDASVPYAWCCRPRRPPERSPSTSISSGQAVARTARITAACRLSRPSDGGPIGGRRYRRRIVELTQLRSG